MEPEDDAGEGFLRLLERALDAAVDTLEITRIERDQLLDWVNQMLELALPEEPPPDDDYA